MSQEKTDLPVPPLNPFEVLEQLWLAGATELELQVTPSQVVASFKLQPNPKISTTNQG